MYVPQTPCAVSLAAGCIPSRQERQRTLTSYPPQEVWQADPETPARGPRVCCKLRQLQGPEEGTSWACPSHTKPLASTRLPDTALTRWQLIKKLSATPTLLAQNDILRPASVADSQAALQANKATFFFQLVGRRRFYAMLGQPC